jgi:hypothetical protein
MQHIPLLHVFDSLNDLDEETCGLTLIQSHHLRILARHIIVIGFHRLERLNLDLKFVSLHIL